MWTFRQFTRSIRGLVAVMGLGLGIVATGCGRDQLSTGGGGIETGGTHSGGTSGVGGSNPNRCGNDVCEDGEFQTCPRDCEGPGCGDGFCDFPAGEGQTCPVDCGTCNDGICNPDIDPFYCPDDCRGGFCGDGTCSFDEDVFSCPIDCGFCSDGVCGPGEDTFSCPQDCTVCGDMI